MDRTQIYLTEEQKAAIAALSEKTGESQSALIRSAIDHYIAENREEKMEAKNEFLETYAGMWADEADFNDDYFESLRAGADARVK